MNLKTLSLQYISACLLVLLSLSVTAQQKAHKSIDSLLKKLAVAKADTNKTKLLIQLSKAYLAFTRSDSSVFYSQQALDLSQKQNWQTGIVNSERNLGDYYYRKRMFAKAHEYFDEGFHASLSINNDEATVRLLSLAAAAIYFQKKNCDQAISYLLAGAQQYRKAGKTQLIPVVYMEIAAYDELQYHYSAALDNFNKGFQLAETTPHVYMPGGLIAQAVELYRNLHDYKKATAILLKSIAIYKKSGKKIDLADMYFEMAQSYNFENDQVDAIVYYNKAVQIATTTNSYNLLIESEVGIGWMYFVLKKYDSAYIHSIKSLALAKTKDTGELAYPLSNLGSIYRDAPLSVLKMAGIKPAERYEKSISLLILANSKGKYYNDIGFTNDNLYELSKTYEKMHRYADAFSTYKSYIKSKDHVDSLKNEKDVLLKEAQRAYTHKEDSLKYQQNITSVQLKQKKQQGYFFIAGIIGLLLLSLFIGLNYYNQRKSNTLLADANDQITNANHELNEQREEITAQRDQLANTITDLKAAQQQLIQSEKMASLGELAAGIAHEIQNPLNFVNNFSEVSVELVDEMQTELNNGDKEEALAISEDIRQNLEKIRHHGKRADGIVKGMLEHSRASTGRKEPTDLNKLADEYLRLAYHGLRTKDKTFDAKLVTHFDENLPLIHVIPQDIGRVLLNLFNNAFYAVQQRQNGAEPDYKPTVELTTFVPRQGFLGIKVKDNGAGIPEAIKDKIMQPFFTTKPTGQGTGLGLSLSYDIVTKAHGGQLTVTSAERQDTQFEIILPF